MSNLETSTASKKVRIVFVDDEPPILTAIERQLRKDRARWEMVFAVGGQRALDGIHRLIHKPGDAGTLRQAIEHAIDAARPRE